MVGQIRRTFLAQIQNTHIATSQTAVQIQAVARVKTVSAFIVDITFELF
jgi:hypothetical protein